MDEKGFHLSYYVGPIISQLEFDGFRLLVDQPSQYGFESTNSKSNKL